jgi:hypothetical protein
VAIFGGVSARRAAPARAPPPARGCDGGGGARHAVACYEKGGYFWSVCFHPLDLLPFESCGWMWTVCVDSW